MTTQFSSNLPNVQQEVCIDRSNFNEGNVPNVITVVYQNKYPYRYSLYRTDDNGNYCYRQIVVASKKKKKTRAIVCGDICIISDPNVHVTLPCTGSTQSLGSVSNSNPYSNQLDATGGTLPYTYTISAGSLPPLFTLSSSGLLSYSGTPASTAGTYTFTVQATDSNGCIGTQVFTLTVADD